MEAIVFIIESVFQFLQISDSKNTKDNNFKFSIFKTQNSQFSVIFFTDFWWTRRKFYIFLPEYLLMSCTCLIIVFLFISFFT